MKKKCLWENNTQTKVDIKLYSRIYEFHSKHQQAVTVAGWLQSIGECRTTGKGCGREAGGRHRWSITRLGWTYCTALVTETVCDWHKTKIMKQKKVHTQSQTQRVVWLTSKMPLWCVETKISNFSKRCFIYQKYMKRPWLVFCPSPK